MRRSIKKAMSLTLASAMTLSLAACGGSNTAKETTAAAAADTTAAESSAAGDAADSQEPVELKFSWWGGDSRHEEISIYYRNYRVRRMVRLGRETGIKHHGRQCSRCNADQLELDRVLQR